MKGKERYEEEAITKLIKVYLISIVADEFWPCDIFLKPTGQRLNICRKEKRSYAKWQAISFYYQKSRVPCHF
jgi:hypothetical protein